MFGELLRAHRLRRGLTQEELAEKAGLNLRSIGKLEASRVLHPRSSTVRLIADALGLTDRQREDLIAAAHPPAYEGRGSGEIPAQLPGRVSGFVGRERQLTDLSDLLDAASSDDVVIAAINGTAGVGKTALALYWAHQVRHRFPDGQLYINLRGYDAGRPIPPGDALASFLRAVGTRDEDIPRELDERAAAYRSKLDGRHMLILLDNASTVAQVRPLLPGGGSCLVIVTSRDSLAGLVVRHGAHRIELDLLTLDESAELLCSLIGARARTEADWVAALAEQCARLPLALRVAAERAAAQPATPMRALVGELDDRRARLELLDADGDSQTAVSAVFSWSYLHLSPDAALMFRVVGWHPGGDVDPRAAAASADVEPGRAARLLEELLQAHLVHVTAPGRYGMHDLLRAYARTLGDNDPDEQCHEAAQRLYEYYLTTTQSAIADAGAARAWFDNELPNLIAICAEANGCPRALDDGCGTVAPRLSSIVWRYLPNSGRLLEAQAIHGRALDAARSSGDLRAQAHALAYLGNGYGRNGEHTMAEPYLEQAVDLARALAESTVEALAVRNLTIVSWFLGRHARAVELAQRAIQLSDECHDLPGLAAVLTNRADFLVRLGRSTEALHDLDRALTVARQAGDPQGIIHVMLTLGELHRRQGNLDASGGYVRSAIDIAATIGDPASEGLALRDLGSLAADGGDLNTALDYYHRALDMLAVHHPLGEAHGLARLGDTLRQLGRLAEAAAAQERALAYFRDNRDPCAEGETLTLLGWTRVDLGEFEVARAHFGRALELAVQAGIRHDEAQARRGLGLVQATIDDTFLTHSPPSSPNRIESSHTLG